MKKFINKIALAMAFVLGTGVVTTTLLFSNGNELVQAHAMSGSGTASDPYIITTRADLSSISSNPTAYYKLGNDIDLGGSSNQWSPISGTFAGYLDGCGKTINNLYIDSDQDDLGLFQRIDGGTVKNLTVRGSIKTTLGYVGGIVYSFKSGLISGCHSDVNITAPRFAAGIAGGIDDGAVIEKCYNTGNITIDQDAVGGIVAYARGDASIIRDCYNTGTLKTNRSDDQDIAIGGIAGALWNLNLTIQRCHNYGTITESSSKEAGSIVGQRIGGDLPNISSNYYIDTNGYKGIGGEDDVAGKTTSLNSAQFKDTNNFSGWEFGSSKTWSMGSSYPELNTIIQNTVTFDKQGGTGGSDSVTAINGQAMPSASMPAKTGYTFGGYYTGKNGSGTQYYTNTGASARNWDKVENTILYAKWTANTYTVKYNANKPSNASSNVTGVPADATWTYDSNATLGSAPKLTGWTFGGWYKEAACTNKLGNAGQTVTKPNLRSTSGTANIYAKWTANTYTVRYNANKPTYASSNVTGVPANATWTYDSNATLGSAPSLTGWTFGGWYKEAACTTKVGNAGATVTKPNLASSGTANLYAKWTANTYNYAYDGNKPMKAPSSYEVIDIPEGGSWTYDGSTSVTLGSAPSLTGYVFDGWYRDSACTGYLGDAEQEVYQPNLTATQGGNAKIYAKWKFNAAIQDVVDKINATHTVSYEELTSQIETADAAYNELSDVFKAVVDSEGYTHILDNAKAADEVGQMIEDLGPAEDTPEWREAVEAAREAYDALEDKTFIPTDTILKILTDDEASIVVMNAINDIGDPRWTTASKNLIDTAQNTYDAYIDAGHPHDQVANYQTLVNAHTDYNNVQSFVDKVNDVTDNPFEYTTECKALIDEARRYYEEDLSEYQKEVVHLDAESYYQLLLNYENAYHAMYLIDQINDMENTPECGQKIADARSAVDSLDPNTELPLMNEDLLKELTDKEAAWSVIEKVNAIDSGNYSTETEEAIENAKEAYDSLTEEQKRLITSVFNESIENKEAEYAKTVKIAKILVIVLLVVASLVLLAAAWFIFLLLKKKKNDNDGDNNNLPNSGKKTVKAMSIGGILPLVIYTSRYLDAPYLALYVIAGLAVLAWLAVLTIFLVKRYKKAKLLKAKEEEEEITYTDENGNKFTVRYIKSFLAKLIQSNDDTKRYYQELKNFALSYEGTTSRVSWNYDSINLGKTQFVKFGVRGKSLCLYLPLNTEELDEKYKVEKIESLKYEKVPCMYRITSERRLRYAKTLIRKAATLLKIKLGEEKNEEYSYPYEDRDALIMKGLIRVTKTNESNPQEEVLDVKEDEEGNEIITTKDGEGHIYETRYVKSFTARLIQADDETKDCYSELKNYALSYQDASARLSWLYDSINIGKESLLKFNIRRNTLCIYYALDVDKLGEKYKVEKVDAKKYSKVPCLYRINARRINYAKELIDRVMKKHKLVKGDEHNEDYHLPYEEKESLVKKGYIRESKILVK